MALLVSLLCRRRRPEHSRHARRGERGATLTEYGLIVALVVVASMGAILQLQDESGSYLVDTGSDIGTPRELAADMNPDLPDEPDWLPQPPPPTTTTTAPPTTSTTAAPTSTTAASTTSTTAAPTTTTTVATTTSTTVATTSTTAASYPVGAIIYQGAMYSDRHHGDCYQVTNPGQVGSAISRHTCDNGNDQKIAAVGTATVVAITWTDSPNAGLCLAGSGANTAMVACNGSTSQLFNVLATSGWIRFQSQANTSLCIAEYSDSWKLETCSTGTDRQRFKFP